MIRPPGPRNWFPGHLGAALLRDRLAFLDTMTRRYGDVVFMHVGGMPMAILNHPDYVRDVLVTRQRLFHKGIGLQRTRLLLGEGLLTSEDDYHLRHRRLMQPAFHKDRILAYGTTMAAYAERRAASWTHGQAMDASIEMAALTMTIAGKTLFDTDLESEAMEIGAALTAALAEFNFAMIPFGDRIAKLPVPPAIRFRRARARLDAIIYRLIAQRRGEGRDRGDLLSTLVFARDVEVDNSSMTDEEIRDEVMTILLAGYETVTNALTWSWYLLALHPDVEQRLHDEVDGVLQGRAATVEGLRALGYARAVIAESMRLFPPAYVIGRRTLAPYDVPGTPFVLPRNTMVFLSQHLLHRDPRFWRDPERFDPGRWSEEPAQKFAYFPFGGGTRICIGEHFAWMEATLLLATLAQRWRLRLVPGHPVTRQSLITLRPKFGMRMTCASRIHEWSIQPSRQSSGV
jgi:cytochrome P450